MAHGALELCNLTGDNDGLAGVDRMARGRTWARMISASSMRPISRFPMPPATPPAEYDAGAYSGCGVHRSRRIWPTRIATCPTCCPRPRNSPAGCSRWAWATAAGSSSTTTARTTPRRAPGGCSACSAPTMSRSSTAASPNGSAEGRPIESGKEQLAPSPLHRLARRPGRCATLDQMKANVDSGAEQVVDARSRGALHRRGSRSAPGRRAGPYPGLEEPAL